MKPNLTRRAAAIQRAAPSAARAGAEPAPRPPGARLDPPVAIRALTTVGEFARCVELQREVWGWSDLDLMPVRLFVLMRQVGGLVLGACEGDAIVGFVNCTPGVRGHEIYWHSHMMGVLSAYQNRGIGSALKGAQRLHALRAGVRCIEWVFDPLQAKSGYLNFTKLGAVAQRYSVDHHGRSSSPLHAGLASDRLVAEWHLGPLPFRFGRETRTIAVPDGLHAVKRTDSARARALQIAVREQFLRHLRDGFVVVGCEHRPEGIAYVCRNRL